MWLLHYYLCGLLEIGDPREDRLRSGDGIRVSIVTYFCRGNPALCWQRSNRNVRLFLGSSIPGTYPSWKRKFLSLTICWKSKETIRDLYGFSCRTYHSLMVAPHCLDGSYSRHKYEMPMLAKIYIIFSKCFLHYALIIISKMI